MAEQETAQSADTDITTILAAMVDQNAPLTPDDLAEFDALLGEPNIDPKDRVELLQTLWNFVRAWIDFEWRHHPIQQVQCAYKSGPKATDRNACGQVTKTRSDQPVGADPVLKCTYNQTIKSKATNSSESEVRP